MVRRLIIADLVSEFAEYFKADPRVCCHFHGNSGHGLAFPLPEIGESTNDSTQYLESSYVTYSCSMV